MLVKTRSQGQLPGLVSLWNSIRQFDLAGFQSVARQRIGVYRFEGVSTTGVTFSNPGASMSKDDVIGEVLVHGNSDKGHDGARGQSDCSCEVGGCVRAGTVRRTLGSDKQDWDRQALESETQGRSGIVHSVCPMTYDNSFCTVRYSLRDFFGHALPMHWANVLTVLAEEYVGVYLGDRRERSEERRVGRECRPRGRASETVSEK